jgi:hypothetical protein
MAADAVSKARGLGLGMRLPQFQGQDFDRHNRASGYDNQGALREAMITEMKARR